MLSSLIICSLTFIIPISVWYPTDRRISDRIRILISGWLLDIRSMPSKNFDLFVLCKKPDTGNPARRISDRILILITGRLSDIHPFLSKLYNLGTRHSVDIPYEKPDTKNSDILILISGRLPDIEKGRISGQLKLWPGDPTFDRRPDRWPRS